MSRYFYIENAFDGENQLTINTSNLTLQYRIGNTGAWMSASSTPIIMNSIGERIYLQGTNTSLSNSTNNSSIFRCTQIFNVGGDITTTLDPDGDVIDLDTEYTFKSIFKSTKINNTDNLKLPSINIKKGCYQSMFENCSLLKTAPEIPDIVRVQDCFNNMFTGCTLLKDVNVVTKNLTNVCIGDIFTGLTIEHAYIRALNSDGYTYTCYTADVNQKYEIINLRKVVCKNVIDYINYFYIENDVDEENQITFNKTSVVRFNFEYSTDLTTWNRFNYDAQPTITRKGDRVYFRGQNDRFGMYDPRNNNIYHLNDPIISCTKNYKVGGDITTLLRPEGSVLSLDTSNTFAGLFYGSSTLMNISKLILPSTSLSIACYASMFMGCTKITKTFRELPATIIAPYCYFQMFMSCTSLKDIFSILPAMIVGGSCYSQMFENTDIRVAPKLPAKLLRGRCYENIFYNCRRLQYVNADFTQFIDDPSGRIIDISDPQAYNEKYIRSNPNYKGAPIRFLIDYVWGWLGNTAPYGKLEGEFIKHLMTRYEVFVDPDGSIKDERGFLPPEWITYNFYVENEFDGDSTLTFRPSYKPSKYSGVGWEMLVLDNIDIANEAVKYYENPKMNNRTKYDVNKSAWKYIDSIPFTYTMHNKGERVYLRAANGYSSKYGVGINSSGQKFINSVCSSEKNGSDAWAINCSHEFSVGGEISTLLSAYGISDCKYADPNSKNPEQPIYIINPQNPRINKVYGGESGKLITGNQGSFFNLFNTSNIISAYDLKLNMDYVPTGFYWGLFAYCPNIVTGPRELPAQCIGGKCYKGMFSKCTRLINPPELNAILNIKTNQRDEEHYLDMFSKCENLTKSPIIHSFPIRNSFSHMFENCFNLQQVTIKNDNKISGWDRNSTENWLEGVRSSGTFIIEGSPVRLPEGPNGVPVGWTIEYISNK